MQLKFLLQIWGCSSAIAEGSESNFKKESDSKSMFPSWCDFIFDSDSSGCFLYFFSFSFFFFFFLFLCFLCFFDFLVGISSVGSVCTDTHLLFLEASFKSGLYRSSVSKTPESTSSIFWTISSFGRVLAEAAASPAWFPSIGVFVSPLSWPSLLPLESSCWISRNLLTTKDLKICSMLVAMASAPFSQLLLQPMEAN